MNVEKWYLSWLAEPIIGGDKNTTFAIFANIEMVSDSTEELTERHVAELPFLTLSFRPPTADIGVTPRKPNFFNVLGLLLCRKAAETFWLVREGRLWVAAISVEWMSMFGGLCGDVIWDVFHGGGHYGLRHTFPANTSVCGRYVKITPLRLL